MKYIKRRIKLIKENNVKTKSGRGATSVVVDLCVCMLLINPNFMDNLLDKGLKGRYTNNSSVFITDLKNLLFGKNRLKVGKFLEDNICIEDTQMDRVNSLFNEYSNDFDIEEDWNKLVSARNLARNIQDKIFLEEKLTEDSIKYVYWLGPNKTDEHTEDIVIETIDDKQYSVNINKKINLTKTQSFNTILNTLFGKVDSLYSEDVMLPKWDKLTREWVKLIYNNAKPNIKSHIKKFIDPERIESLTYFGYFDIKHSDKRFENLGELIPELNKNILELSDLLGEIWKQREICLENLDVITKEWDEKKIFILNSRIIEYFITNSFKKLSTSEVEVVDGYVKAKDKVKMRMAKLILNIIGSEEKDIYYFTSGGNSFYKIPSRNLFRENYDSFDIYYDCHTELTPNEDEELNDSNFKIKLKLNNEDLLSISLQTKFSGLEMSGKLSSKYKIEFVSDFNYQIFKLETKSNEIS
jgi:hypothetical protein